MKKFSASDWDDSYHKKSSTSKVKKKKTLKEKYKNDLKKDKWYSKRYKILLRDNFKCCVCGNTRHLEVHHLIYQEGKKPWEYKDKHLITLCKECHTKIHSSEKHKFKPKFINKHKNQK